MRAMSWLAALAALTLSQAASGVPNKKLEAGKADQDKPAARGARTDAPAKAPEREPVRAEEVTLDEEPAASEIELSVSEQGPGLPWRVRLTNTGERQVRAAADPRLLWFEVKVPGKAKRRTCRLPAELFPTHPDRAFSLMLRPGDSFQQVFDPRLYCFAAGGQTDLVAGAVVYPRFGWQKQYTTSYKHGKRVKQEKLLPPFAVTPPEPPGAEPKAKGRKKLAAPTKETHLKLVEGKAFGLKSAYAGWSKDALPESETAKDSDWEGPTPVLSTSLGSDAAAERTATVTVKLRNPSKEQHLTVFFRRELLSFEVMGPDGLKSCEPEPRTRFPEAQAFTKLAPGKSISVVSRLVELCPRRTFDRPGLYLIRARFDSRTTGDQFDLQAFTGRVVADKPATVRIRTGEKRFRAPRR